MTESVSQRQTSSLQKIKEENHTPKESEEDVELPIRREVNRRLTSQQVYVRNIRNMIELER